MDPHKALDNEDVLYLICNCLTPDIEGRDLLESVPRERAKTLARLARVCKNFHLPALRILWRRLQDMRPLLRLFSGLEIEAPDDDDPGELDVHTNAILPPEWARFCMYAEYVQVVETIFLPTGAARDRIPASTWTQLARLSCGSPLLPHLRELGWVLSSPNCTGILRFLSPTITQLKIACFGIHNDTTPVNQQEWQSRFQSLLPTVFSVASKVTRLTMNAGQIDTFCPQLSNLHFLRYFRCTRVNIRILQVLAALNELEELHVRIFDTTDQPSISFSGFPKLRVLVISEHPSSNLVYNAFSSPRLHELIIGHYPPQHLHNFTESCEVWARRFPSLRHLSFYLSLDDSATPRPLRGAVRPLLILSNLRSVGFSTWYTMFTIDDADVVAFAEAWPRMRHLKLAFAVGGSGSKDTDPSACPTPSSILALATKCPDLRTIHIRRLEVGRGTLPDLSQQPARGHGLECFSVQNVEVDEALVPEFARWIDRLFPHLVPEVTNPTGSWQAVMDAVKACQTERRQQQQS
ncbi:hypothetical protein LXA43DRAFT_890672 [Ganoderma leucocontextum]|nr:hypothetical protein LXA43DRAFT_890672 [Ganoderma leucocontextum]